MPESMKPLDEYSEDDVIEFLRNTVKLDNASLSVLQGVDGTVLQFLADQNSWAESGYAVDKKTAVKIRAYITRQRQRQLGRAPASAPLALLGVLPSEPFVLQSEEPHRFIEQILKNQYVKGAAILREALQNAEDARATEMHIALDLRQHPAETLLQDDLSRYQGPALVLVNNSAFSNEDFDSFKRMYRSGKAAKPDSIGKFGLGSRSFFHVTDKIFLLSSQTLVVVGPSKGMKYTVQEVQQYKDQLQPFLDFESMYPTVTVFRLPLRTAEMEQVSPIKAPAYSVSDAEEMIEKFRSRLDRDLLFLRHVRRITAERWDASGEREQMFSVSVTATPPAQLASLSGFLHGKTFEELVEDLQEKAKDPPAAEYDAVVEAEGDQPTSVRWHVSQRLCADKRLLELMPSVMVPPLIGVALPEEPGFHDGHACYLPFSVRTGLPVQLHAAFAVTDDRRSLWQYADDMQGESLNKPAWNAALKRALARAYMDKLRGRMDDARYYEWWPDKDKVAQDWHEMVEELRLLQRESECLWSPSLQHAGRRLVRPRDAVVLSREFIGELRTLALGVADNAVEVPARVESLLRADLRLLSYEQFLEAYVFPPSRWRRLSDEQKDTLLLDLLGQVAQSAPQEQADWAARLLQQGVPELEQGFATEEPGVRKSLTGLFDPTRELAELVGVRSKLLRRADFARQEFLPTLRRLGLGSELDLEMLAAVARQVAEEGDERRAQLLVRYLDRQGPEDLFDEDAPELFEEICWIPTSDGWRPPCLVVFDAKARDLVAYQEKIRPLLCQLKVPLCELPQDVQKALLRVQQGDRDLEELNGQTACKRLRKADAGGEVLKGHSLELLDFLVEQLMAQPEDLEGVPLLKLESGELSCFDSERRFFSCEFFKLQPRSPERFLHRDVDGIIDPKILPGWTKFRMEDIRPEGVLQPDQLEQLDRTGSVASTDVLLDWVRSFLGFVDSEDCYEELGGETWPSLPIIPTESEVLSLRDDSPPVLDLSTCKDEQKTIMKDFCQRIGCATLRDRLDIPDRARAELCTDAPRLAKYLLDKIKAPIGEMELTAQEKDALSDFLLSMPSFALDFLWLPIFPVRGEHIAPKENIWVDSEELARLLRPYGVHLITDAEGMSELLKPVDAPSSALKRAEASIQRQGGLHGRDLEELIKLSAKVFSPEERRELGDLRLLPEGQRLRDKFKRADPLVQELLPALQDVLLPSDIEQRLAPEIRELLRVPSTADSLDELLKIAAAHLEDIPRPESYRDEMLGRLEKMPQAEVDKLSENLDFRDRQVIPMRRLEGFHWYRPREVFVGGAKQLVNLTSEPVLGKCPPHAEKLFALAPRPELVAEQLALLCKAPPWREAEFRPVFAYLDAELKRDGSLPELSEPFHKLRGMRCLLMADGELEYPHLVCRDLSEESPPFVPVPPLLRGFDALLTELQARERVPPSLPDTPRLDDWREVLYRDTAYADLELVAQDGSVRAHRCIVSHECPGSVQLSTVSEGGALRIDLSGRGLTKVEVEFLKEYVYKGRIKKSIITLQNAERLMQAAQDFQLSYLQDYLDLFSAPGSLL